MPDNLIYLIFFSALPTCKILYSSFDFIILTSCYSALQCASGDIECKAGATGKGSWDYWSHLTPAGTGCANILQHQHTCLTVSGQSGGQAIQLEAHTAIKMRQQAAFNAIEIKIEQSEQIV